MAEKLIGNLIKYSKMLGFVVVLIILVYIFDTQTAVWAFLLYIIVISLWSCWQNREMIWTFKETIDTMLFGKPLRKELWKPGELNKVKTKFVWRKTNGDNKNKRSSVEGHK